MSFDLPTLPENWVYKSLDRCAKANSISYGVVQPGSPMANGVPLIRVNNFSDGRVNPKDLLRISPEIESKYVRTRLHGGEVLLTLVGSVGQVAIVPKSFSGFNVARAICVIHPNEFIGPEWMALCLRSSLSQSILESRANTTVQTTINLKDVRALPIPVPPIHERRAIVEVISALDDRITLLRETNATLEAIAQAIFKSWFVDFDPVKAKQEGRSPEGMDEETAALFPDSFEESELGMVPRGWMYRCLKAVFEINPARPLKKGQQAPYIEMADVGTSGHVVKSPSLRGMGSGSKFSNGDTLLARITPCLENGKTAFIDCLQDGQIGWGSTEFLVLHPKPPLPAYFGYLLCRHQHFRDFAVQSMSGTSGRQRIQNDVLGLYPIAIPSLQISDVFGLVISGLQEKIASNHATASTLANVRDNLLPRLISGQLRLPEVESIIAEAV